MGQGSAGGQLIISLNGIELGNTLVGTNIFATEIAGMSIVTVAVNSTLQIINPAGNGDLLLTQNAGDSGTSNSGFSPPCHFTNSMICLIGYNDP